MAMAYVKLHATLLDSSVWDLPDSQRIIWVTLMSMADWNGRVHASVPGLANRARKSIAEVEEALGVFMSPDKYSRTKDHDGRRVEETDGGWLLLNYVKHRDAQSNETIRARKRDSMRKSRQALPSVDSCGPALPSVDSCGPDVDECGKVPSISVSQSRSDPDPEGVQGEPVTRVTPRKSRVAPADLEPTGADRLRCTELKHDADDLMRAFKLQEFTRDYDDWPRRFSKWIEDQKLHREPEATRVPRRASGPPLALLEPSEGQRRAATKHGVDVDAIVAELVRHHAPETLGLGRARELIGEMLSQAIRARRARAPTVAAA